MAVVEDLVSRKVVGWSMAATMESRLVVDAVEVAIARRRPDAGLPAHSDRGGQYASDHDQRVPTDEGIVCGVSGVGPCRDNAPVESFFGSLKRESGMDALYPPATRRGRRSSSTWECFTTSFAGTRVGVRPDRRSRRPTTGRPQLGGKPDRRRRFGQPASDHRIPNRFVG